MPLVELPLDGAPVAEPPRAAAFVRDARQRIRRHLAMVGHVPAKGLVPSEEKQVLRALCVVRALAPDARRFLEWGSGLGVATGLAELLGFEAHGIEIEDDLVLAARELLADHALTASIVQGSFVPAGFADAELWSDLESRIVLHGEPAYREMDLDLDDFDVVFAYPWPTEVELYLRLFDHGADFGAILLLASRAEGARAFRKVGG